MCCTTYSAHNVITTIENDYHFLLKEEIHIHMVLNTELKATILNSLPLLVQV